MLAEIAAGLSSLKAAGDIIKGLNAAGTHATINEIKIGLQNHIFEAREALSAAQEAQIVSLQRIRDLEKQVAGCEAWEAEKQRYELHKLPPGILIYRLKPDAQGTEPPHEICANCYQKGQKSLLHNLGEGNGLTEWRCHACGFNEQTGHFHAPTIRHTSDDWMA